MSSKHIFPLEVKPQEGEEDKPIKVEKWDWNAVKNALDDAARKYLVGQENFKEDHALMNGRLIISTVAVVVSLYGILYDYLYPFPQSRTVLMFCVAFYFVFIGILTYYTAFVEKGCFAAAKQYDESGLNKPNTWKLSSKQKKYDDIYTIEIEFIDGNTGLSRKSKHESSVARYFDDDGILCTNIYYKYLSQYFSALLESKKTK